MSASCFWTVPECMLRCWENEWIAGWRLPTSEPKSLWKGASPFEEQPNLMNEMVQRLQREAERIASKHPPPDFYTRFKAPHALARKLFFTSPVLMQSAPTWSSHPCRRIWGMASFIALGSALIPPPDFGGDSSRTIFSQIKRERLMQLGLICGLLHDICRNEERHAEAGAYEAGQDPEKVSPGAKRGEMHLPGNRQPRSIHYPPTLRSTLVATDQ